jgi:uncharacterized protein YuzE
MIRTTCDKEADAAYIYVKYPVKAGEAAKTVELDDNPYADVDKNSRLLGIEMLHASKALGKHTLLNAKPL